MDVEVEVEVCVGKSRAAVPCLASSPLALWLCWSCRPLRRRPPRAAAAVLSHPLLCLSTSDAVRSRYERSCRRSRRLLSSALPAAAPHPTGGWTPLLPPLPSPSAPSLSCSACPPPPLLLLSPPSPLRPHPCAPCPPLPLPSTSSPAAPLSRCSRSSQRQWLKPTTAEPPPQRPPPGPGSPPIDDFSACPYTPPPSQRSPRRQAVPLPHPHRLRLLPVTACRSLLSSSPVVASAATTRWGASPSFPPPPPLPRCSPAPLTLSRSMRSGCADAAALMRTQSLDAPHCSRHWTSP